MHALLAAAVLAMTAVQADTSYLYRAHFVRAAPGELLELIDAFQDRMSVFDAADEPAPYMMRHAQGDQWDLLLMYPMGSFVDYYSAGRVSGRERAAASSGASESAFQHRLDPLVAWREDVFVLGPALETMTAVMNSGAYFHTEMFIVLPGKRDELFHEREMENDYQARTGRPVNMIFTRVAGAFWDSFTLGIYRDLQHFAERSGVSAEDRRAAAIAAGFEGPERVPIYMRSLILKHNDTHGGVIARRR